MISVCSFKMFVHHRLIARSPFARYQAVLVRAARNRNTQEHSGIRQGLARSRRVGRWRSTGLWCRVDVWAPSMLSVIATQALNRHL